MPNFKEASSNVNRARQFMPFAALKGYYDLVDQKERLVEPRRDMSEEDALQLSCELAQIRKGSLVRVVHYDQNAYVSTEGMVSQIDETSLKIFFRLKVPILREIPFFSFAARATNPRSKAIGRLSE